MAPFAYRLAPRAGRRLAWLAGLALLVTLFAAPAPAGAAVRYRGVQLHSLWSGVSYTDLDHELDLSRDVGANAVRVDVAWSSLETAGQGQLSQWYVDKLDYFVAGAQARGMKVIATLWSTPCWASSAPDTLKQSCTGSWWDRGVTKYMPTNLGDYARMAQWMTSRYGTKLAALEIWNEPNEVGSNFLVAADKPASYAALVKAAYPLAKTGNADVPVLAGALSFADRPFLDALYANGMKGYYDGISVHPYNEWRAPGDLWQDQWKKYTLVPGLRWIRDGQQAVGDSSPIWVTEFGWTTCTVGADRWCVTEQQQAQYVHDSFPILAGMDYVQAAMVYNLRNKGTDAGYTEDNFGLVRRDFSLKPSYAALKQALTSSTSDSTSSGTTSGTTSSGTTSGTTSSGTTSGTTSSGTTSGTTSSGTASGTTSTTTKGRKRPRAAAAVTRRRRVQHLRRCSRGRTRRARSGCATSARRR